MKLKIERDQEGSRLKILQVLLHESLGPGRWLAAKQVLGPCTASGPWSEDLQDLVEQGVVESQDPVGRMGNKTLVRLATVYKQAMEGEHGV